MAIRRTALRGLMVGALTVPAAAFTGLAPYGSLALAATGTVDYDCSIFGSHFDYPATVSVTVPPSANNGDTVTVSEDLSALPGVAPLPVSSWTTTGSATVSGAQTGTLSLAGPSVNGPVAANQPIPLGTITGDLKLSADGTVSITPGALSVAANASGALATITCSPTGTPAALATITVGSGTGTQIPTVAISPASLAAGSAFTVTGGGWDSGTVDAQLCAADGTSCSADDLSGADMTATAAGALSGGATVKDSAATGVRQLKLTEGNLEATAQLTITAVVPPAAGSGRQTVDVTVNAGPLTMTGADGSVHLSPVTLDGTAQQSTGGLQQVQVEDARGGATGWSLVGTLTDFSGPAGATIAAGNLNWTPKCTGLDSASPVTTGTPGPLGSTGSVLCSVPDSTTGPVGGRYDADAGLALTVPPATAAGQYQAILTLTLS